MTKIVESVTTLLKSPFQGGGTLSDRFTRQVRAAKGVVKAGQKYDPFSKYVGYSMVPGVDSRKEINQKVADDKEAAAREAAKPPPPTPMPSIAAEELAAKRRAAASRRGGRTSTVLSDTLG